MSGRTQVLQTVYIYAAWATELVGDRDRDFILHGIRHGFDIVNPKAVPAPVETPNNKSARPGAPLYNQATQQILGEIEQGNYIVCTKSLP